MIKQVLLFALFLLCLVFSDAQARPKNAAYFTFGETSTLLQERVGPEGGVFIIKSGESWIDGSKIEVPAGALPKEVSLTVSYNDGSLENVKSGSPLGGALQIEFSGISKLDKFATLWLPFMQFEENKECMGFLIDDKGSLDAMNSIRRYEVITFRPKTAISLICS